MNPPQDPPPNYAAYSIGIRDYWTSQATSYFEPGKRAWSTNEISWGIWDVPEAELNALGDSGWFKDKDVIELGCGTAYVSAWLAKLGAKPVGIDITPAQLESARAFQKEFGIEFPLIEGTAENVPFPDGSFDFAISEYGAAIWCDPYKWIPEAARLLRPGGRLAFLGNSLLSILCMPDEGPATSTLCHDQIGLHELKWEGVSEFHISHGEMIRLLIESGFRIDGLVEIYVPPERVEDDRFGLVTLDWARRWPTEEIWKATKL